MADFVRKVFAKDGPVMMALTESRNQAMLRARAGWRHLVAHNGMYGLVIALFSVGLTLYLYRVGSIQTDEVSKSHELRFEKLERQVADVKNTTVSGNQHLEKVFSQTMTPFLDRMKEQNKVSIRGVLIRKETPPLRIFSEEPYGEFNCFAFEVFDVVREDENSVVLSNQGRNPAVKLALRYGKKDGGVTIEMDSLRFNSRGSRASYKNYLDFLRFQKALMSNARLVFWNLLNDEVFLRTDHILPVNMEYNDERAQPVIDFCRKIVRIEHWLGKELPFQVRYTKAVASAVDYIAAVLDGEDVKRGTAYERRLSNLDEKKIFLKSFWRLDMGGTEYRMEGKSDVVELFGMPIDLGMWTLDFPPATVSPALEQLTVDSSSAPVVVAISLKDHAQQITLHHNMGYRKDDGL